MGPKSQPVFVNGAEERRTASLGVEPAASMTFSLENFAEPALIVEAGNLRILSANESALRQQLFTGEEAVGRTLHDLFCTKDGGAIHEALSKGEASVFECRQVGGNGEAKRFRAIAHPTVHSSQSNLLMILYPLPPEPPAAESEAKFHILAEITPAAVFIFQGKKVLFANHAAEQISGFSREEICRPGIWEKIAPEFSRRLPGETGVAKSIRFELKFVAKCREERWLDVMVGPMPYRGATAMVAVAMDITARKEAEENLKIQKAYLERLFESAPEAIVIVSPENMVLRTNEEFERLFGFPRDEILGKALDPLILPAEKRQESDWLTARSEKGESAHVETVRRRYDGSLVDVSVLVTPVNNVGGGQHAHYCIYRDITERKRNEQLQRALYRISEQASSDEDLDTLFQSIHEIVDELIEARNFYIALWDPAHRLITFPYHRDEASAKPPGPMPKGRGLTGYVLATGRPLLATPDVVQKLVDAGEVERSGKDCRVWLGVPLRVGANVIGVLALQSYDETIGYGEQEKDILIFVSQHVATAIQRKRDEEALRESESRYRSLVQSAVYGMYNSSIDDRFEYVNPALVKMLGYDSNEEVLRLRLSRDVYANPEDRMQMVERYRDCAEVKGEEIRWKRRDGKIINVRASGRAKFNEKGETVGFEMIAEDTTERRSLEEQLRQSQKMEAVGRLAGGIAHDFNNLLTVMKGYSELMLSEMKEDDPVRMEAEEIKKAADRASGLTRQLLAFSRRQVLAPKVLDLNSIVVNMDKLLRPLLREDVLLRTVLAHNLGRIKADPGQIEQVIMNLAVNARDAMPAGGRLTIETSNAELDPSFTRDHADVKPGRYVMLAISDSGVGMDEATMARVFEPFFTTKEMGKGTGLGLSTVYGIIKQSDGYVWVYSEVGVGTIFKIFLPRVDGPSEGRNGKVAADYRGTETVLLVEDEDGVRSLVRHMLQKQGYTVLDAGNTAEALLHCKEHREVIHLLLTDVTLEHASGRILAEKLLRLRPEMKLLYISGYTDDSVVYQGVLSADMPFLQKPFTAEGLVRKVRQVLDGNVGKK
ncbi:MAG TPA: PAS domain S-box protein [Candidatus Angelobacter sp.]|nr:PAS domain S-box protein [Candidatus Angelobacter sp.]